MTMRLVTITFLLSFLHSAAFAFIPPLTSIVKEVFGERRNEAGVEAHLKHRITLNGTVTEIDERILRDSSGAYFTWRSPGNAPVAAIYEKQTYALSKEKTLPTRSTVFWKYLVEDSDNAVRDALLTERFIRRDQFTQYKNGFNPSGEPSTWELKENYIRHDDIFLSRLPGGVSIAVRGYLEGATARVVYFNENLAGMSRLEWKDGDVTATWTFSAFGKSLWEKSVLPRRAQLEINGAPVITTEIVAVRGLKERALFDAKTAWKNVAKSINLNPTLEPALKVLVSYR